MKLEGSTETFTISVRYDTQALFGKIEDSRKVEMTVE
jgi:hypothetical protein